MSQINGWAASAPQQRLEFYSYDPGPLAPEDVEIAVEYCGVCHSDLSVIDNAWGLSSYPVIPGHEVIGRIVAKGEHAKGLEVGQHVGVGWNAGSCMHCSACMTGEHNLCPKIEPTIINRQGGFAERIRCHWAWLCRYRRHWIFHQRDHYYVPALPYSLLY